MRDIVLNKTGAIVYYEMGEYPKAVPYIEAALKTNCKNPELLCRAGLIYGKVGDKEKARMFLEQALKDDAVMPEDLKEEGKEILGFGF